MRILHTSDWHLGRLLHQHSLLEDQAHILAQITELAIRESVDAVLIAGDIYDRALPPADAVALFDATLRALCQDHGIAVVAIAGNHDSPERVGFGAALMTGSGYHVAGPLGEEDVPVTLRSRSGDVELDVFCVPFFQPAQVRDRYQLDVTTHQDAMHGVLQRIAAVRRADRPAVLMAHCFVAGASPSDSERELSVGGIDRIGADTFAAWDYVALGHLHRPQTCGAEQVRYSGSPLKYSFSEAGHRKSVTLVDFDGQGLTRIESVELEPRRDVRIVRGDLQDILAAAAGDGRRDDYIQAVLTDTASHLDVMNRLREVYPNTLQMFYEARQTPIAADLEQVRERLHTGHAELFASFFAGVQGEPMSEAQEAHLASVLARAQEGHDDAS